MNRKLYAGTAALAAVALLAAGCSSSSGGSGDGKTTISITWSKLQQTGMAAVVAAFEKANPDITVKAQYNDVSNYNTLLRTQLQAGSAADIFYVQPGKSDPIGVGVLGASGYLADLSDQPWVKDVSPILAPQGLFGDGKTGALQVGISTQAAMYNDEALKSLGLTPPKTFDEVLGLCKKARDAGKVAYALGAQDSWSMGGFINASLPSLLYAGTPDFNKQMADGKATFADSKGWNDTLDLLKTMLDAKCFNDNPTGVSGNQANEAFGAGKAVGLIDWYLYAGVAKLTSPKATFTVAPFPTTDSSTLWMGVGSGGGAAVNAKAKDLTAAKKFIAFYAQPDSLALYAKNEGYSIPSVVPDPSQITNPNLKLIEEYTTNGRGIIFAPQTWPNPDVQTVMGTGLQAFLAGAETKKQVLDAMQAAYDKK